MDTSLDTRNVDTIRNVLNEQLVIECLTVFEENRDLEQVVALAMDRTRPLFRAGASLQIAMPEPHKVAAQVIRRVVVA
jgi:hypothetical protein